MKRWFWREWPAIVAFVLFIIAFDISAEGPMADPLTVRGIGKWIVLIIGLQFYLEHRRRREDSR